MVVENTNKENKTKFSKLKKKYLGIHFLDARGDFLGCFHIIFFNFSSFVFRRLSARGGVHLKHFFFFLYCFAYHKYLCANGHMLSSGT